VLSGTFKELWVALPLSNSWWLLSLGWWLSV